MSASFEELGRLAMPAYRGRLLLVLFAVCDEYEAIERARKNPWKR